MRLRLREEMDDIIMRAAAEPYSEGFSLEGLYSRSHMDFIFYHKYYYKFVVNFDDILFCIHFHIRQNRPRKLS